MDDSITHTPRGWHPCVNGRYPTQQPDPARDEEGEPKESEVPPRAGEEQEARDASDAPSDPAPKAQEEPEQERVPIMREWLNRHWDTVEAMARAGEAPVRPAPPPPPRAGKPAEPRARPHVPPGDRWTKWKMAEFLRQLAATHSVTAAARSVGMSRESAHRLRNRLKGQPFDIAWEAAFRHGYDNLAHAALELALEGHEVPHYHRGELIGTHRKPVPQLMIALLKLRNRVGVPMLGRYGAAAEYWSESWDTLLQRVETGAVDWRDERSALGEDGLKQLDMPDKERELALIEQRNRPDDPPGKRRP